MYSHIRDEINKMYAKEQSLRSENPINWELVHKVDAENCKRLIEIVNEYGFISNKNFGAETSSQASIIMQHFPDTEIEFLEKYLSLMTKSDEDHKQKIAYLTDLILMMKKLPQRYGTRYLKLKHDKFWKLYKVENLVKLNSLRAEMGLNTIEERIKEAELETGEKYKIE